MERYTPGPWKYSRTHEQSDAYWYVITDAQGYGPIVDVGGKDKSGQIAEAKHLITDPLEIEANARLIAAAPDLLKACENLIEALGGPNCDCGGSSLCAVCNGVKAITKAKGGDMKEIHFFEPGNRLNQCYVPIDGKNPDELIELVEYQRVELNRTEFEFIDKKEVKSNDRRTKHPRTSALKRNDLGGQHVYLDRLRQIKC